MIQTGRLIRASQSAARAALLRDAGLFVMAVPTYVDEGVVKATARAEGMDAALFDRVEGEHAAIMGLPMLALLGFLRQHGHILA